MEGIKKVKIISKGRYKEIEKIKKEFKVVSQGEDAVIVVGGDGLLIKAMKTSAKPVIGIKSPEKDSMGFNMPFSLENLDEAIEAIKSGKIYEKTFRLVEADLNGRKINAVNEIGVVRCDEKSIMLNVYYRADKEGRGKDLKPLIPFPVHGDGILFSSRFGSNAWNRNLNGPLLLDEGVVVKTIASDFDVAYVSFSSIVFHVNVTKGMAKIVADGENVAANIKTVDVYPSKKYARLLLPEDKDFFDLSPIVKFYYNQLLTK